LLEQLRDDFPITVEAPRLVIGSLVLSEVEPHHALQDCLNRGIGGALAIGVFDTQHEIPAMVAGIQPRVERGAGATDVEEPRWARRETGTDFHAIGWCCSSGRMILADTAFDRISGIDLEFPRFDSGD